MLAILHLVLYIIQEQNLDFQTMEENIMKEKVILAYSGGLDTTAIIPWLKENYDYDVICCCIDCGQEEELQNVW